MNEYLCHHGIKGQRWGVRRYQNEDGSYTNTGKKRRSVSPNYGIVSMGKKKVSVYSEHEKQLLNKNPRMLTAYDHYYRNTLNINLPKTVSDAKEKGWHTVIANAHQFTKYGEKNIKYVSPDGKREVVYNSNGKMITNPLDMGSYNYCPSEVSYYGHFKYDILPWIAYGNAPNDPSTVGERVGAILNKYNKRSIVLGKKYCDMVYSDVSYIRFDDL